MVTSIDDATVVLNRDHMMQSILDFADQRFVVHDNLDVLRDLHILKWPGKRCNLGIALNKEVVILNWRRMATYRVQLSNLAHYLGKDIKRVRVYACRSELGPPLTTEYVNQYLCGSEDNPYSVWNLVQYMMSSTSSQHLTQFPPLRCDKEDQDARIDEMRRLAQLGDVLFSFDRTSGLSHLIRRYDWCMWSHCAMCCGNNDVVEVSIDGATESNISDLNRPGLDVGLYRLSSLEPAENGAKAVEAMRNHIGREGYPWLEVVLIGVRKNLRWIRRILPTSQRSITPADLMYSNQFKLVCYA